MDHLNLFETLPEGFRMVEDEIDHKLASLTVTQAFADSPYPVPSLPASHSALMQVFHDFSEEWIDNAEKCGLVLTNEDYSAVLVLTPIDQSCNCDNEDHARKYTEMDGKEVGDNCLAIMNYIGEAEEDLTFREGTVYIEAFAVQTPKQGQKLGSKLMRQLFEALDKQKRDVFLFTNTEKNASIYTHFGFETVKKLTREDLNSTTWFMLRRPE